MKLTRTDLLLLEAAIIAQRMRIVGTVSELASAASIELNTAYKAVNKLRTAGLLGQNKLRPGCWFYLITPEGRRALDTAT